jgi:hypothetical protein
MDSHIKAYCVLAGYYRSSCYIGPHFSNETGTGETVMVAHVFRPVHLIFSPENWKSSDQLLTVEAIETNIRYLVSASQCIVLSSSVNNHKSMHVGYHANLKYLFIAVYL